MKLSQASIGIRKAAWMAGIKDQDAEVTPFFDHANAGTEDEIKVKIGAVSLTSFDIVYADHFTWEEVKDRS